MLEYWRAHSNINIGQLAITVYGSAISIVIFICGGDFMTAMEDKIVPWWLPTLGSMND